MKVRPLPVKNNSSLFAWSKVVWPNKYLAGLVPKLLQVLYTTTLSDQTYQYQHKYCNAALLVAPVLFF